ncbi:MAG TPA: hypothetical protein VHN14_19895 [Kofleriaceae bacterium]|nr:hypothetical protein [Kofleriaceae bacterium]
MHARLGRGVTLAAVVTEARGRTTRLTRHRAPYHEIAAQLVLMAFLHRVINGGGSIEREYAIGRGRIDLCLRLGDVTVAMELKTWREARPDPLPSGLAQLDGYLDGLGLPTG